MCIVVLCTYLYELPSYRRLKWYFDVNKMMYGTIQFILCPLHVSKTDFYFVYVNNYIQ